MALSSVRKASESAQGNTLAPTCANDIERKAMALVSITEAARLVGVSEKTIRRKIATGEVSAQVSGQGGQARKVLDTSELIRVFGSMPGQMPPPVQPQVSSERIKLMVILAVLGCIGAAVLAWAAGYRI